MRKTKNAYGMTDSGVKLLRRVREKLRAVDKAKSRAALVPGNGWLGFMIRDWKDNTVKDETGRIVYIPHDYTGEINHCGTVACIAGWGVALGNLKKFEDEDFGTGINAQYEFRKLLFGRNTTRSLTNTDVDEEFNMLCFICNLWATPAVTPKMAIEAINCFLKEKPIDWKAIHKKHTAE